MEDVGYVPSREVVLVEDLQPVIERVLKRRKVEWEHAHDQEMPEGSLPVSDLAEQSGLHERAIYRVLKGESLYVDLDLADRLCLALGLFIELELPEAILPEAEVHIAVLEQTEHIWTWGRCRGYAIPQKGTKERRSAPALWRRHEQRERRGRAA